MATAALSRARICTVFSLLTLAATRAGADVPAQLQQQEFELDEVLVTGERPGPAMWKVSKDGHTLWIMGTLSPLPAKMTWRSKEADAVIGRSAEILANSVSTATFESSWAVLRNMRALLRLRHNADGSTLREALPADVHARWAAAHRRWFGKDPDPKERARPMYAAELLYQQALERVGLTQRNLVWNTVARVARERKVKIRQREFEVKLDDPKKVIAELAALPRDKEVACLVATMDYIDSQLPDMRRRAQAWAVGDLAALRGLPRENPRHSCVQPLLETGRLGTMAVEQAAKMQQDWSGIVDWMLLTHATSFTVLPIQQLLDPDGSLARLRERGYTVEEPL